MGRFNKVQAGLWTGLNQIMSAGSTSSVFIEFKVRHFEALLFVWKGGSLMEFILNILQQFLYIFSFNISSFKIAIDKWQFKLS